MGEYKSKKNEVSWYGKEGLKFHFLLPIFIYLENSKDLWKITGISKRV